MSMAPTGRSTAILPQRGTLQSVQNIGTDLHDEVHQRKTGWIRSPIFQGVQGLQTRLHSDPRRAWQPIMKWTQRLCAGNSVCDGRTSTSSSRLSSSRA
jgi:hypothetical protein